MEAVDRGVSKIISVILMVAIVVILAATASVFFFDVAENISEPGPNVADTTGEFVVDDPNARDNQIVRITHIAGEGVAVEEIEIIARASGPDVDTEGRLIALPADGLTFDDKNFDTDDTADLIDNGNSNVNNIIISDGIDVWSAGDTIRFRINTGEADFREGESPEANELKVIIVHTPSGTIISQNTFTP